jgi:hypothetical protein
MKIAPDIEGSSHIGIGLAVSKPQNLTIIERFVEGADLNALLKSLAFELIRSMPIIAHNRRTTAMAVQQGARCIITVPLPLRQRRPSCGVMVAFLTMLSSIVADDHSLTIWNLSSSYLRL